MARYLSCLGVAIAIHHINFCMQFEPSHFFCFFFLEEFVIHGSWSWLIRMQVFPCVIPWSCFVIAVLNSMHFPLCMMYMIGG